jgi:hypothetical protein
MELAVTYVRCIKYAEFEIRSGLTLIACDTGCGRASLPEAMVIPPATGRFARAATSGSCATDGLKWKSLVARLTRSPAVKG